MGSALLVLLFVADATLDKSAPMHVSAFVGLPKAYENKNINMSLAAMPAPAPDMSSDAVRAASVVTAATATEPAPPRAAEIVRRRAMSRSNGREATADRTSPSRGTRIVHSAAGFQHRALFLP